jgi:hypothetical protein
MTRPHRRRRTGAIEGAEPQKVKSKSNVLRNSLIVGGSLAAAGLAAYGVWWAVKGRSTAASNAEWEDVYDEDVEMEEARPPLPANIGTPPLTAEQTAALDAELDTLVAQAEAAGTPPLRPADLRTMIDMLDEISGSGMGFDISDPRLIFRSRDDQRTFSERYQHRSRLTVRAMRALINRALKNRCTFTVRYDDYNTIYLCCKRGKLSPCTVLVRFDTPDERNRTVNRLMEAVAEARAQLGLGPG